MSLLFAFYNLQVRGPAKARPRRLEGTCPRTARLRRRQAAIARAREVAEGRKVRQEVADLRHLPEADGVNPRRMALGPSFWMASLRKSRGVLLGSLFWTASGGYPSQKMVSFPLAHHLGGDFDHGQILRPVLQTAVAVVV